MDSKSLKTVKPFLSKNKIEFDVHSTKRYQMFDEKKIFGFETNSFVILIR